MKLTNLDIDLIEGYELPKFDVEKMRKDTQDNCNWIHFGAGNLFRGFPAARMQDLLEKGLSSTGIVVGECFDFQIIDDIYHKYDNNSLLITLKGTGKVEKKVISSVAASYKASPLESEDYKELKRFFKSPSLQMVSFTITEKGYDISSPFIQDDILKGPNKAITIMPVITSLAIERFKNGAKPFAFVSMDNCSHNGEKLKAAVISIAKTWVSNKKVNKAFLDYLEDTTKVAFPWSMIDKITPRPDPIIKQMLVDEGFEDNEILITDKNTYIAPFVNTEESEYLVIEDTFPNGRPRLEESGIYFTDRDTVNKVEKMKVCTCLNPLHTAMSIVGCLLGYNKISDEMEDIDIVKYIKGIGYDEGLKVVVDPKIISPKAFIDDVINNRLANPFMPDTPQRISTDTSQKISIRFGETVKAYIADSNLDEGDLKLIPFFMATYIRYLMGINDEGDSFTLSSDPRSEELWVYVKNLKLKLYTIEEAQKLLKPILQLENLWGFDLYNSKLKDVVVEYFVSMVSDRGMVRKSLHSVLK
ncbi:MAG: mannitol dehydrogenase family protein [Spirochaetaceae bacterium]|nr:mannitol dehydrogenase family protein [Spirochaetaceae bacterium]